VWQWVEISFYEQFKGEQLFLRGGGWYGGDGSKKFCFCNNLRPFTGAPNTGFRLAQDFPVRSFLKKISSFLSQ
jgi:formylglycine-generating enzyme required for sulfatase activity